ncbi:MAG: hypothetical protein ACR2PS_18030 [Pseudomonadales bacterium]
MHSLGRDIEQLNQKVLLFAAEPSRTASRYLGIHPNVNKQLKHATSMGCHSAIACGVPLVQLRAEIIEDLAEPDRLRLPSSRLRDDLPELLSEINLLALHLAQRTTLLNPHLAILFFGLTKQQLEHVAGACASDFELYAARSPHVVELRGAASPTMWERIMIGGRIGGPRGLRISHDAALLSLQSATT